MLAEAAASHSVSLQTERPTISQDLACQNQSDTSPRPMVFRAEFKNWHVGITSTINISISQWRTLFAYVSEGYSAVCVLRACSKATEVSSHKWIRSDREKRCLCM